MCFEAVSKGTAEVDIKVENKNRKVFEELTPFKRLVFFVYISGLNQDNLKQVWEKDI